MLEVGKVCMKIAGRDAGKFGVVLDVLDDTYVLLDGEVRRRKCNIHHLEPLDRTVDVKKNATHSEVLKALGITEAKKKTKAKKEKVARPLHVRIKKKYATAKKEPVEKKTKVTT